MPGPFADNTFADFLLKKQNLQSHLISKKVGMEYSKKRNW